MTPTPPHDYAGKNALEDLIEDLMGKRSDRRFAFIQQNAEAFNVELDV